MTDDAERARLRAYAEKRSAIVSTIWVIISALLAAAIGAFNGLRGENDLNQFLDNPDSLGPWLVGGAVGGGAVSALFVFAPLYLFVLRKSDFGTGKAALIVFGAGIIAALAAVMAVTLPVEKLTLTANIHREAARDDIRAFQARAGASDLVDPLMFSKANGPDESIRKAKALQGLVAEQQIRQAERRAAMAAVFKRRGEGKKGIADLVAAELEPRVGRNDDLVDRYWSLRMDYFKQIEEDAAYLTVHRSAWTLNGETLTFRDEGVLAEWRRRRAQRVAAEEAMSDSIAALNAPQPGTPAK